jgi:hypothetical protein
MVVKPALPVYIISLPKLLLYLPPGFSQEEYGNTCPRVE